MGFVGSLVKGAVKNTVGAVMGGLSTPSNFQAQSVPLQQGVSTQQINDMYGKSMGGMDQQQAFLNAIQAQNGLGNQSNVFNQQQALANQMQALANGQGPNPAMAQLANTTGQNVANQAALMAGQRGAGANAGLMARQIGQQGANIQQQAVGQGAAMNAQQQIAAMNALQQQQGMMGNLAGAQVGQQANALNAYNQSAQNMYGQGLQGLGQYNSSMAGQQGSINQSNATTAAANAAQQGQIMGGLLGGVGAMLGKYDGGMIEKPSYMDGLVKYFSGGAVVPGAAMVSGDSPKNDMVPAMLSPKEIVLPRSVTLAPNAPDKAKAFVSAVLARKGMKK